MRNTVAPISCGFFSVPSTLRLPTPPASAHTDESPPITPPSPPDQTPLMRRWVEAEAVCSRILRDRSGNRYDLSKPVGRGAFGAFYVARCYRPDGTQEVVGLKQVAMDATIEKEARAMLVAQSPLASKRLLMVENTHVFMETAVCDGTLHHATKMLRRTSPQSAELLASSVLKQVCTRLSVLHSKGWVHRDIKPDNILYMVDGQVYLGDYGRSQPTRGQKGPGLGTSGFMSPQATTSPCTPADDIFALGVSLLHIIMGETPFDPCPFVPHTNDSSELEWARFEMAQQLLVRFIRFSEGTRASPTLTRYFAKLEVAAPRLYPVLREMLRPRGNERPCCVTLLDELNLPAQRISEAEQKSLKQLWTNIGRDPRIERQIVHLGAPDSPPLTHSRTFDGAADVSTGWLSPLMRRSHAAAV